MNKLEYSISLREKGLSSSDIKLKMKEKGFDEAQIQYYLEKSDDIFLNQSARRSKFRSNSKTKNGLKMITLILSLILLSGVFFGYARIGILGLIIVWSLVKYSSYRK